jgi:hypothetical protein
MGGRHSRQRNAFTNDLQSDNGSKDDTKDRSIQCCNGLFFCPIPLAIGVASSPLPSLSRVNSGHTANTSGSGGGGGIFGTPIPDTPPPNRRMRDNAVVEKYYYTGSFDLGEEKKSTSPAGGGGGRFGRGGRGGNRNNNIVGRTFGRGGQFSMDNYVSSSKYMGLEKEVSDDSQNEQMMQPDEKANYLNGNAEIHDGPVSFILSCPFTFLHILDSRNALHYLY